MKVRISFLSVEDFISSKFFSAPCSNAMVATTGAFCNNDSEFANAANSGRCRSPLDDGERQSVTQTMRATCRHPNRWKVRL